ncbi:transcription initiation factor IIE subunit beta-like [Dysidea avara]|uniref:transcription initiation factor IIE subunit beta-like n=1 Tax=Dysidea avara TaxID=196820 RepID=UPI00332B6115
MDQMDPALRAQREAFLKRAKSNPISSSTVTPSSSHSKSSKPKKKKKKSSLFPRPKPPTVTGPTHLRSKNQLRWLKAIVDFMKAKYFEDASELTFDEIMEQVQGTDLPIDTKEYLRETLKENPKIEYKIGVDKYVFQPTLRIKNRHQLAALLERNDREGLGGIKMSDVEEALSNPQRAIRKLDDSVLVITRQDKEKILFYNNKDLLEETDEGLKALWRTVGVDGVSESDIEQYLKNAGLTSMLGIETSRKRKAPTSRKPRKQARSTKILNVHLDQGLLKDYSSQ